jgi:uncharacterized protein
MSSTPPHTTGRKIVIAGGSGFLGQSIINKYWDTPTEIVVLTRNQSQPGKSFSCIHWDGKTHGDWARALEGSTAVINLVGRSVNCRYTATNKQEIINSRVNATRIIGEVCRASKQPPKVWINAGSAAIFGDSGDEIKNEDSTVGEGFSPEVCKKWEETFLAADTPGTRKVFLRMGLVLQKDRGLLKPFINMARLGLGGRLGDGRQYISWIHERDFTGIIEMAVERDDFRGIIHCTSPFPVTNSHFMKALRSALRQPFGLPNPALFIKAGAVFAGTEAGLVLSGRRVVSKTLNEKNFPFQFPDIDRALKHLIH